MNEAANRGGMIVFIFTYVFSCLFIVYVVAFQPGPIDTVKFAPGGLSQEDLVKRRQEWATSTPEKVENGRKLFQTHFGFQVEEEKVIAELNSNLKASTSEIGLFNFVTNGMLENVRGRYLYIPEDNRWDIAHYLRSKVQNPATSTKKEWDDYLNYGF